jgi:hypothetical protein
MAYRNGTYVAFHADGNNLPGGKSDIDYYRIMQAWSAHPEDDFAMVNSHEKASAVRDSSLKATLRASLLKRLANSKNMILIIGKTTSSDTDWVPFEIENAVDVYKIPIIAAYTMIDGPILNGSVGSAYWPQALRNRINNGAANVIHIPFKKAPILDAISQFSHNKVPNGQGLGFYVQAAYEGWGIT